MKQVTKELRETYVQDITAIVKSCLADDQLIQDSVREIHIHMAKITKIGRDAGSGKFIPVKEAQKRPKTTVVETIKRKK